MLLNLLFFNCLNPFKWLKNNLIPCPFKKLTGIDCPGCGFQRSVIALVQGNLKESFHLYPAAIPLLVLLVFSTLDIRYAFSKSHFIKKSLYVIIGILVTGSYLIKMSNLI
jgi:hypothetical protein